MPKRMLLLVRVYPSKDLLAVYTQLGKIVQAYENKVDLAYGQGHARSFCKSHPVCIRLLALRMMGARLVEDGASSVIGYAAWKVEELQRPIDEIGGRSICEV